MAPHGPGDVVIGDGDLIRERLRERLPNTVRVLDVLEADSAEELIQHAANGGCVMVLWDGDAVIESKLTGTRGQTSGEIHEETRWLTIIAVHDSGMQYRSSGLETLAGEIEVALKRALLGWEIRPGQFVEKVSGGPRPGLEPTFGMYTLAWAIRSVWP